MLVLYGAMLLSRLHSQQVAWRCRRFYLSHFASTLHLLRLCVATKAEADCIFTLTARDRFAEN